MTDVAAVVAAAAGSRGIGNNGSLPWRLPGDMAHFKRVTTTPPAGTGTTTTTAKRTNAVIMGRKTWDSIPPKFRPLPDRTNVVLTRSPDAFLRTLEKEENVNRIGGIVVASSLDEATQALKRLSDDSDGNDASSSSSAAAVHGATYVVGGAEVYREALNSGLIDRVVYTEVSNLPPNAEFDAFFPDLDDAEWECCPYRGEGLVGSDEEAGREEDVENSENCDANAAGGKGNVAVGKGSEADEAEFHTDPKSEIQYRFLEYRRRSPSVSLGDSAAAPIAKENIKKRTTIIEEGPDVNPEEMQYLDLCRDIIENGIERGDRTGTGTLSKFGTQMRFSLRDGTLPLLTTKRTFWRGVAEELLWFIQGNTNGNDLAAKDIHIWDGNGSREFLDQRGLSHREVGDLGPVYGFQWRHFGAKYVDMHTDYSGQGVDQLAECIEKIKTNPEDRRIILSAWNPKDLDHMALPPCHMFCQFYVDTKKGELSCQMYQRSADMGLGVPFNIASYALLTHMMARVTNLKPGDFVHTIGDAHVYLNHVDALKEQLERPPRAFPKLKINPEKKGIDDFVFEDFEVVGYKPHKTIKMKMAV